MGRRQMLERLDRQIDAGTRLIALTGPRGIGKTRLSVERIARVRPDERSLFVEASAARDLRGLVLAIAERLEGRGPIEDVGDLAHALSRRGPLLLVLDRVDGALSHLGALTEACAEEAPDLVMVVTSRTPPPPPFVADPARATVLTLEPLSISAARELFVSRAAERGVHLDGRAPVLSALDLLEGNPLAIELAAASLDLLSAAELKTRLERKRPRSPLERPTTPPAEALLVHTDGAAFRVPGAVQPTPLCAGGPMSRLMLALARQRLRQPGAVTTGPALVAMVWRDERIQERAARNRLHVALSGLRKAGLAPLLERIDGGYRLDPDVPIRFVESAD